MGTVTFKALQQMGMLGNQLFQMAATIGYARNNNKSFVFPRWSYQNYMPVDIGELRGQITEVAEDSLRYTKLPYAGGNVNIHGHLLSTKYFMQHRDFLLNYFRLADKYENYIHEKYGQFLSKKTCSIHVRRGNYLQAEQLECHGLMGMPYFDAAAVTLYPLGCDDIQFIVCSDDIAWCKENMKAKNMLFIEGEKDIIDLFIMSKCRDNIIPNSTFSWWSAWLNQHPEKRVVAPKQWFTKTEGWPDLYGEGWIII